MRWEVDGGASYPMVDNHIVAFEDGQWWGHENILPRNRHGELFHALKSGADKWLHYTITPLRGGTDG